MLITRKNRTRLAAVTCGVVTVLGFMAAPASAQASSLAARDPRSALAVRPPAVEAPKNAIELCEDREWERVSGGQEILYNDVFDASRTRVCISDRDHGPGFAISSSRTPHYGWQAYPNLFTGCWYTVCSAGPLPAMVSRIQSAMLSLYTRYPTGTGSDATDFWFDKTNPGIQAGHPDGLELMLWGAWHHVRTGGELWFPVIDHRHWLVESWIDHQDGTSWRYVQMRLLGHHRKPSVRRLNLLPILHWCEAKGWLMPWWWAASLHAGFEVVNGSTGDRILRYSLPVVVG
jgi:hypothetical protein